MATVRAVLDALERIAPSRYAFDFDRIGLQLGRVDHSVTKAAVSLDRSRAAVKFAKETGCQLLLSHHPLFFKPMEGVTGGTYDSETALQLAEARIAFIAAHTNWDSAVGGINDALAERLGLNNVTAFGGAAIVGRYLLTVYVPEGHVAAVIDAAAASGAGSIGAYRRCAYVSTGTGTFIPGDAANPMIGENGIEQRVTESRIEMVVLDANLRSVERAIRAAHPYEEPAIHVASLAPLAEQPAGRVGNLDECMSLAEFAQEVRGALGDAVMAWGDPNSRVRRVAVCGGAADGEWRSARAAGADVFLTGEVKQHVALEASESGMAIVAAGHYATEQPSVVALATAMGKCMPEIDWQVFEPMIGFAGRPQSW